MLDDFRQDLRHALRSLIRRPLVSAIALLSLALGLGVNTTISRRSSGCSCAR